MLSHYQVHVPPCLHPAWRYSAYHGTLPDPWARCTGSMVAKPLLHRISVQDSSQYSTHSACGLPSRTNRRPLHQNSFVKLVPQQFISAYQTFNLTPVLSPSPLSPLGATFLLNPMRTLVNLQPQHAITVFNASKSLFPSLRNEQVNPIFPF